HDVVLPGAVPGGGGMDLPDGLPAEEIGRVSEIACNVCAELFEFRPRSFEFCAINVLSLFHSMAQHLHFRRLSRSGQGTSPGHCSARLTSLFSPIAASLIQDIE